MPLNNVVRTGDRRGAIGAGLLAVLLILAWQGTVVYGARGGDWTALFCSGDRFPVPAELAGRTYVFPNSSGYDGQFYRLVAHDPLLQRGYAGFMDSARYRYGRILVPLLAAAGGVAGPAFVDAAYIAVVVASIGLGVYWTALWLQSLGFTPMLGLVFLLAPATVTAVDRMTIDATLCALFAGYVYHWRRGDWTHVAVIGALAALTRETGLLLVAGAVAAAMSQREWKRAATFAATAMPALGWLGFVATRTPPSSGLGLITWPFAGVFAQFFVDRPFPGDIAAIVKALQILDKAALAGLAAAAILAFVWVVREKFDAVGVTVLCFAVLGAVAGAGDILYEAFNYGRPISPLLLWLWVEAIRRRAWWAIAPGAFIEMAAVTSPAYELLRVFYVRG
jgi:hypothetical protein